MHLGPYDRSVTPARHLSIRLLVFAVAVFALLAGAELRRRTWEVTTPIRFERDVIRGYGWGLAANGPDGFLNLYEKMSRQRGYWSVWLDYAPLRLGVMSLWARYNLATQPDAGRWRPDFEFNAPVLHFNAAMELVAAAAAFLIVRRVVRLAATPAELWARPYTGWGRGLAAALLLWFNPAMIVNGYAWPSWDVWVVPMYLLALLAALYGRWALSGGIVAAGVMLKFQQLVGVPIFLGWALLGGRRADALRWAGGFVATFALIASPWIVTAIPAGRLKAYFVSQPVRYVAPQTPLMIPRVPHVAAVTAAVVATALSLLLSKRLRIRRADRVTLVAAAAGSAILLSIPCFGASSAWFRCSVSFGLDHFPGMVVGPACNLSGVLWKRLGIENAATPLVTLGGLHVTIRHVLVLAFLVTLLVLVRAVAWHARRHDTRWLVAVTAPWLAFFWLMPQMHERYLLYPAAIGSILVGRDARLALASVYLSVVSAASTVLALIAAAGPGGAAFGQTLHNWRPDWFTPDAHRLVEDLLWCAYPDAAWTVFILLVVLLYSALRSPSRPVTTRPDTSPHAAPALATAEA